MGQRDVSAVDGNFAADEFISTQESRTPCPSIAIHARKSKVVWWMYLTDQRREVDGGCGKQGLLESNAGLHDPFLNQKMCHSDAIGPICDGHLSANMNAKAVGFAWYKKGPSGKLYARQLMQFYLKGGHKFQSYMYKILHYPECIMGFEGPTEAETQKTITQVFMGVTMLFIIGGISRGCMRVLQQKLKEKGG